MIPDTSGQDTVLGTAPGKRQHWHLAWLLAAVSGAAAIVWLISGFVGSERSIDMSRLRIGEVTRGTLVRDASVNGRVVAAVSPTLYAPAASTVTLKIHAGDTVHKGDLLAVLDSPELSNQLA
ncbi:MAG: biotin/lipoyl-binding protein, partial [Arenimonas sp.]